MINSTKLGVWVGGIGLGKAVSLGSAYAESMDTSGQLSSFMFKELVGLIGGPAAIAIAWKLSRNPRTEKLADIAGLAGVEMFIDRLTKYALEMSGQVWPQRIIRAPPPGGVPFPGRVGPFAQYERLPFQSDITW